MKSILILATLLTLTACCGCVDKPKVSNDGTMMAPVVFACSTVKVTGMHCEACAETVTANLKKIKGVKDVQVDVTTGTVLVFADKESSVKKATVKSMIEKSGYTFNSIQSNCNKI